LNGDNISILEENLISEFKEFIEYTPERPIIFTRRQQEYISRALLYSKQCIQPTEKTKNDSDLLNDIKQNLLNCIVDSHL
jgi:hypothetical protein